MAISDPVFQVTSAGIAAPSFAEVLDYYQTQAKSIFGQDVNLDPDTQDGQLISIFAAALSDVNAEAINVYSAYNPQSAIGVALDSAVKTNGIARRAATHSTADVTLSGANGTVITDGTVRDADGNEWSLPPSVTIVGTSVTVTATCTKAGAIEAAANTITTIGTPTAGWTSVTNVSAATPGVNAQTDAELRQQQAISTMQPSLSLWEGILGAVGAINDVVSVGGINNDTSSTSAEGIPAHAIALVVYGGDADTIGETIFLEKSAGVPTYGSTSVTYTDRYGNANTVNFTRPTAVPISVAITISQNPGYTSAEVELIKSRIASYINGLGIGVDVNVSRVLSNVIKTDDGTVDTFFNVTALSVNGSTTSVTVDWDEMATCDEDDIVITGA